MPMTRPFDSLVGLIEQRGNGRIGEVPLRLRKRRRDLCLAGKRRERQFGSGSRGSLYNKAIAGQPRISFPLTAGRRQFRLGWLNAGGFS